MDPDTTDTTGRASYAAADETDDLESVLASTAPTRLGVGVTIYGCRYDRVPFSGLIARFAGHYVRMLHERLAGLPTADLIYDSLAPSAWESLTENLATALVSTSHRVLIHQLDESRRGSQLRGATPEARYDYYSDDMLRQASYLRFLFSEYPALGRFMVRCSRNWVVATTELLSRLVADLPVLGRNGFLSGQDASVTAIRTGLGDPHNDGRSVAKITFSGGGEVMYKPRPLDAEDLYRQAVAHFAHLNPAIDLRAMRLVKRDGYGWCEFIEHQPASSRPGVRQFYYRIGACLAILLYLGAVDVHMENVIAHGDFPVPVDLETILQNRTIAGVTVESAFDKAFDVLSTSVLATAVLPRISVPSGGSGAGLDTSAIGGGARGKARVTVPSIVDPFTDRMRTEATLVELSGAGNLPFLATEEVTPGDHVADVERGFLDCYDVITENKPAFARLISQNADIQVRHILRPTRVYGFLLNELHHPRHLRDSLDAEELLEQLWAADEGRPELAKIAEAERAQLAAGDVPRFFAKPCSTSLYFGEKGEIKDFFTRQGHATIQRRLRTFGAEHRTAQLTMVRAALSTLPRDGAVPPHTRPPQPTRGRPPDLRNLANRLIRGLAAEAIVGRDDCTWVGIRADSVIDGSLDYSPLPTCLYDGLSGMAFMFAYAATVYESDHYLDLARRSMRPVLRELRDDAAGSAPPRQVGAYTGIAGVLYALGHLATVTGDENYLDAIDRCVPLLVRNLDRPQSNDLVSGLAGAAVVTSDLHRRFGFADLGRVAGVCVERLAASMVESSVEGVVERDTRRPADPGVRPPVDGFAHGAAGIGWALLKAGNTLGDTEVENLGLRTLIGETLRRDPAGRPDTPGRASGLCATDHHARWCRGTGGTGLSWLLAHDLRPEPEFVEAARGSLTAVEREAALEDHSLCHGDFGRLELLGLAADRLPEDGHWQEHHQRMAARLIGDVDRSGILIPGLPGADVPGLMIGRAGVCLSLLRLLAPGKVPSVLWLEGPAEGLSPRASKATALQMNQS